MNASTAEHVEKLLRHWGRVFGERPPAEWDEGSSYGAGALTAVLLERVEVGVGIETAKARERRIRKMVAKNIVQVNGGRLLQFISGLPKYTACGRQSEGGARTWCPDQVADWVELQALDLYRSSRPTGLVLRAQYCTRGTQRQDKLPWVRAREGVSGGGRMSVRQYLAELDQGRDWILTKLNGQLHVR